MLGPALAVLGLALAHPVDLAMPAGGPQPAQNPDDGHGCLAPADRARLQAAIDDAEARGAIDPSRGAGIQRFRFFPQAGRLYRDLLHANYVDLAPGAGLLDWDCSAVTYNGHPGHDVIIRSFAEQSIGVPIYAVLDGVVLFAADGNFDMNTVWAGQPANYVAIDHGDGHRTFYYHLKNGSVAVAPGEPVRAGQQIGLTGSSGISSYPHIHFETQKNGFRREPSHGDCNAPASLWTDPFPFDRAVYAIDAGVTQQNLDILPWLPFELPRTGQIALSDARVGLWIQVANLPANATWNARLIRPNGTTAVNTSGNFGANPFYAWSAWHWWYTPSQFAGQTGTVRWQIFLNGVLRVDAPFEVVAVRDPGFNRPPEPVTVSLRPAGVLVDRPPEPQDVVVCEIDTHLVNDDPDYDVVRYDYVWTIDGAEVRRITSAAHSDMIPHTSAAVGQVIRCEVTPSDGRGGVAPTASVEAVVLAPCEGDTNGDRLVNFADLNRVVGEFNQPVGEIGLQGDLDLDGFVDFADLNLVVSFFNTECE